MNLQSSSILIRLVAVISEYDSPNGLIRKVVCLSSSSLVRIAALIIWMGRGNMKTNRMLLKFNYTYTYMVVDARCPVI